MGFGLLLLPSGGWGGWPLNSVGLLFWAGVSGLVLGCLQHPAEDGAPLGAFSSGNQSLLKGVRGGGIALRGAVLQAKGSTKTLASSKCAGNCTLRITPVASGSLWFNAGHILRLFGIGFGVFGVFSCLVFFFHLNNKKSVSPGSKSHLF